MGGRSLIPVSAEVDVDVVADETRQRRIREAVTDLSAG
jgi:hypothetical protein